MSGELLRLAAASRAISLLVRSILPLSTQLFGNNMVKLGSAGTINRRSAQIPLSYEVLKLPRLDSNQDTQSQSLVNTYVHL
jgi:hypothetical protein